MPAAFPASHYEAIVESSDDAILTKDRDATITSWNPAAERLYGHPPSEAIGQPITILIPADRRGEELEILDRVLAGDRIEHYDTERVTKDGRRIHVSLTISALRSQSGEIVGASVIARDATLQRRAEERATRLQDVTGLLAREIRPDRVVDVLLENAIPALGGAAGAVAVLDRETNELEIVGSAGYSPEGVKRFARMHVDALRLRPGEAGA